jgi:hypothetical protein
MDIILLPHNAGSKPPGCKRQLENTRSLFRVGLRDLLASFSLSSFGGVLSWAIDGNHSSTIEYDLMQAILSY